MTSTDLTPHQYTPLPEPVPITEQNWPEGTVPLVSICCITYNHEKFIEECLEGFLMQETTFPVEILIHDDASTDRTADIIREYAARYPQLFRPIYQTENQYSQGKKPNVMFNFPRAKGKYIALCEGDDYWTYALKLQTQVDFLEAHPNYVLCCHNAVVIDTTGNLLSYSKLPEKSQRDHTGYELIVGSNWILTLSMCLKKVPILSNMPPEYFRVKNGDNFLTALLGSYGGAKYMEEIKPAVYRVHKGGIWSIKSNAEKEEMKITLYWWLYSYFSRIGRLDYSTAYKKKMLQRVKNWPEISDVKLDKKYRKLKKLFCKIKKYKKLFMAQCDYIWWK